MTQASRRQADAAAGALAGLADKTGFGAERSRQGTGARIWVVGAGIIAALVVLPVLALAYQAAQGSPDLWPHLLTYVLPRATQDTLILLVGVGVLVTVIGTGTAWLVTAYDFPGRRILEWALLLPLAVPTYIIAYAYLDILHPIGPVQGALRAILGFESPRDFRLPDIRSMVGCILLLGLVLYPYVYMATRAMFLTQAANVIEVSRTLGVKRSQVFFRIGLPLARPAIAVGVALALMETLNDIGASAFLGVRTLTVSIYTTWVTRSDLPGAAQIALAMLCFVILLVALERFGRKHQRYAVAAQRAQTMTPLRLSGARGWLALVAGLLPIVLGFVVPAGFLLLEAIERSQFSGLSPQILRAAGNTVTISAIATVAVLLAGLVIAATARLLPGAVSGGLSVLSTIGYAAPGTVVAIGILIPVATFDRMIDQSMQGWFGISTGLLILGSGAALIYAYMVRFLAISAGGVQAGFSRISPSLDLAGRTLGARPGQVFWRVHLPLSRPALAAAGLVVFVDCVKELPATLLLRPLNLETLSTLLYGEAARGTYEEGSIAALAIVLIGILPVILLARLGQKRPEPTSHLREGPKHDAYHAA